LTYQIDDDTTSKASPPFQSTQQGVSVKRLAQKVTEACEGSADVRSPLIARE
jgi:hypothetical protein